MATVTGVYTALLAYMWVYTTFAVIRCRRKYKVAHGDGGQKELKSCIRAQANLIESAPMGLLLLLALEQFVMLPSWIILLAGSALLVGRISHAHAFVSLWEGGPSHFAWRIKGMQFTITYFLVTATTVLLLTLVQLLGLDHHIKNLVS